MESYINPTKIKSLISEINSTKKYSELDIDLLERTVSEYYNSISLNLKLFYFADSEYIRAGRALEVPNPNFYNKDLPEGLRLLFSDALKKKFEKLQKGMDTSEEDENLKKIENAIQKLINNFENFKTGWETFVAQYGNVAHRMAKSGKDFDSDLVKIKSDLKEKTKKRNFKFLLIALGAYYLEFAIEKLLDYSLPERWYLSLLTSIVIFIIAYKWIDRIKTNFSSKVKRSNILRQLEYLKNLSIKCEQKIEQTCKELSITFDEYIIELSSLIQKLDSIKKSLGK